MRFRQSRLWFLLRRSAFLRSAVYLGIELRRTLREPVDNAPEIADLDFQRARDPWHYETSPLELDRFRRQEQLLGSKRFATGLEIGCAEGRFTETLAAHCDSLTVLDISPLALERTKARRNWGSNVSFSKFDLRTEPLSGSYDLIVVAGVLEYFPRRRTLLTIRRKLVGALRPGGALLVETTTVPPVVENAWWSRCLPRGRNVNALIGSAGELEKIGADDAEAFLISLFYKRAGK